MGVVLSELGKLPAFFRRDLVTMWSYRTAFFLDWFNLAVQVITFTLLGRLVDANALPVYGGEQTSYVAFVVIGIAIASFTQIALGRIVGAIRNEQLMGTLEHLLLTPTRPWTIGIGSVAYDLIYVPIRTFLFLSVVVTVFSIHVDPAGILPTLILLMAFIPLVWGIGMVGAATGMTFRRTGGVAGLFGIFMGVGSTAYFPLHVFPEWAQPAARANPLTLTLETARNLLLGSGGWADLVEPMVVLLPAASVSLTLGTLAFRWALSRERRRGTLGLY